jgi:shikimate dehydrogenase
MKVDDPLMVDGAALHKDMLVYDVIYAPAETKLLVAAKVKGARTANGLGMLFYQGVLAFQHWAEVELDDKTKKVMRKALLEKVNS